MGSARGTTSFTDPPLRPFGAPGQGGGGPPGAPPKGKKGPPTPFPPAWFTPGAPPTRGAPRGQGGRPPPPPFGPPGKNPLRPLPPEKQRRGPESRGGPGAPLAGGKVGLSLFPDDAGPPGPPGGAPRAPEGAPIPPDPEVIGKRKGGPGPQKPGTPGSPLAKKIPPGWGPPL